MTIVKEVEDVINKNSAIAKDSPLENALKTYHELLNSGKLKPRGNQLASLDQRVDIINFECNKY